jgi:hypothetical protein
VKWLVKKIYQRQRSLVVLVCVCVCVTCQWHIVQESGYHIHVVRPSIYTDLFDTPFCICISKNNIMDIFIKNFSFVEKKIAYDPSSGPFYFGKKIPSILWLFLQKWKWPWVPDIWIEVNPFVHVFCFFTWNLQYTSVIYNIYLARSKFKWISLCLLFLNSDLEITISIGHVYTKLFVSVKASFFYQTNRITLLYSLIEISTCMGFYLSSHFTFTFSESKIS